MSVADLFDQHAHGITLGTRAPTIVLTFEAEAAPRIYICGTGTAPDEINAGFHRVMATLPQPWVQLLHATLRRIGANTEETHEGTQHGASGN